LSTQGFGVSIKSFAGKIFPLSLEPLIRHFQSVEWNDGSPQSQNEYFHSNGADTIASAGYLQELSVILLFANKAV
jgi:hypothetical protein